MSDDALDRSSTLSLPDAQDDALGSPFSPGERIIRASGINVNTVRARIVYAQTLTAFESKIGRLTRAPEETRWQEGEGHPHVTEQILEADVIYTKVLDCRLIEAAEVYVQEAKITRK